MRPEAPTHSKKTALTYGRRPGTGCRPQPPAPPARLPTFPPPRLPTDHDPRARRRAPRGGFTPPFGPPSAPPGLGSADPTRPCRPKNCRAKIFPAGTPCSCTGAPGRHLTPGPPGVSTHERDEGGRGLGWFSIGLGLAEVVAGRELGRALGMEDRAWLLRLFGVREIAAGVAIFSQDNPALGVWARVAGDVARPRHTGLGATPRTTRRRRTWRRPSPPSPGSRRWTTGVRKRLHSGRPARLDERPPGERGRRVEPALPLGPRPRVDTLRGGRSARPPRWSRTRRETRGASMRALCWHGKSDVRVDTVPDPTIEDPRDAIIKITSTCICGSDLHLYDGYMPTMEPGDVIGHEPMGVVVEVGKDVKKLKKGDRVVVPFTISCGDLLVLRAAALLALRQLQPQRRDRPQGDGPVARRPLRLLAHARRLPRRPGRIPPRALRRRRPADDPRRPPRREGRLPLRHLPDRLHGRRERPDRARRHGRRSGAAGRSPSSPSAAPGCSAPGG